MSTPMDLALNQALSEHRACLERMALANLGNDAKRPKAWAEYGYKSELCFDDFHRMYKRGGVAHGVVNRLTEKCWETDPWIVQGDEFDDKRPETPWEADLRRMFKRLKVWRAFMDGDRRRLVGHYSGLLLQIADGKQWGAPYIPGRGDLVRIIPAWEGQLQPTAWDENPASPTYGDVAMWDYQEARVRQNDSTSPPRAVSIHPSRVVILGDVREGEPFLEAGFNDFVNLEKILGGSGESFLKNATRQMSVEFDKDVDLTRIAQAHGVPVAELADLFNQQARDINAGLDALMITQGGAVKTLVASVPDPEPHFGIAVQSAAASVRIPAKIIVGMQTGERASTEDIRDFNKRGQGRRINTLTGDIETFVSHLTRLRLLPPAPGGEFTVVWDDLTESSQSEKLDAAAKMAEINAKSLGGGQPVPFSSEEIRDTAGFDNDDPLAPMGEDVEDGF